IPGQGQGGACTHAHWPDRAERGEACTLVGMNGRLQERPYRLASCVTVIMSSIYRGRFVKHHVTPGKRAPFAAHGRSPAGNSEVARQGSCRTGQPGGAASANGVGSERRERSRRERRPGLRRRFAKK